MSVRIFVPADSAALALGADDVAAAITHQAALRGIAIELVRNGTRGMLYLEPLVEVDTPAGRIGFKNVEEDDVASLFDAGFSSRATPAMPSSLGLVEQIPYLARQTRLTFARSGITDPLSLADYEAHGGYRGLRKAVTMAPADIVATVTASGLRGRGGAAFPTGIKWNTVLRAAVPQKYIVCNADEGDSGTFADRIVMESDPFVLIEGMTIAGLAVGATHGFIYVRSEYPHSIAALNHAIGSATRAGLLGPDVAGSGRAFVLEVRKGAGAYICGEETALLESIEGKRGVVRAKPPLPALAGLFGKPTVINNVLSLASVPIILDKGAQFYQDFGMGRSRGTLPVQLAGNIKNGGLIELAFGATLREIMYRLRRRQRQRASHQGGAGRRPAGRLPARIAVGYTARLRSLCGAVGRAGPRRHRGARRQRRHGETGPLRHGILRRRILRQVHPVPHWLHPRRRSDRQDPRGHGAPAASHPAALPVRHHAQWFPVRHGRHDALPRAVRFESLP